MAGPCSYPAGGRARWEELNEIVCNIHTVANDKRKVVCVPAEPVVGKDGKELTHEWVTRRIYLINRNGLYTGKTK